MTSSPEEPCLRCCIDVPETFVPAARYGLRMLLLPFRATLEWVSVEELGSVDIYYGTHPELAPVQAYSLGLHTDTIRFFDSVRPAPDSFEMVTIGGDDVPALFPCSAGGAFDVIASAFFFLSGWQEFHTTGRDQHGRARYSDSLQSQHGLAHVPIVDVYRRLLEHQLGRKGSNLKRKKYAGREWAFCPTHDIDYEKKWRPGIIRRELLHRAVLNHEKESIGRRFQRVSKTFSSVLSGSDPFKDAMRRMRLEVLKYAGTGTYFFKSAARDSHDVRFSPGSSFLRGQYQELKLADFEIGLHPSYHAYNHPGHLLEERNLLAGASGVQTSTVRSHYLRFDPAGSPSALESCGFKIDSTLGWATHEGFRRGTCLPFTLYDLSASRETTVTEFPLIVMESTLFNRRNYTLSEAVAATDKLIESCRQHGGVFVGLWHNILWDEDDFPGWGEHFTSSLAIADNKNGMIGSIGSVFRSWE